MIVQFVDPYYLIALVNSNDPGHEAALRQSCSVQQLVTTAWLTVEFAAALGSITHVPNSLQAAKAFCPTYHLSALVPD